MRNALVALVLLATAACGAYHFPGSGGGTGTVSGRVTATTCGPYEPMAQNCLPGPTSDCLPNRPNGTDCGSFPLAGLALVFTNGGTSRIASTDSMGHYSIELAAGTWRVGTKSIARIVTGPTTLVVDAGASIAADYTVDRGIRAASLQDQAAGVPTPVGEGARFRTTER